jgi:hypothetical protein
VWQWLGQHGGGFAATAVPARQQGGPNCRGQTAQRPMATTAMDRMTVTQRRQKARRRRNSDGNSDDGDDGDNDKDGGNGWREGDGRRYGDTTEMAAMGGETAHNRGILNLCSNLFVSLSICSSQLILV